MGPDEKRIEAAYLSRCSADGAYEWLEARQTQPGKRDRWDVEEGRATLEYILLRRADPLIDLALARFGETATIIRRVYARGGAGTRCAAWANVTVTGHSVFDHGWWKREQLSSLVATASLPELLALCRNPQIHDDVACHLLERSGAFQGLSDKRYWRALIELGSNSRLSQPYDDTWMDGFDDYRYHKVFESAWKLTLAVPIEQHWAGALNRLLAKCQPPESFPEIDSAISRWQIDLPQKDGKEDRHHWAGNSFYLRSRLADVKDADQTLLESDDKAIRCSFYRRFRPQKFTDWPAFFGKDGEAFVDAALQNELLWQEDGSRRLLDLLCWDVPDPSHDMLMPNRFRAIEKHWRDQRPEWFVGEESLANETPEAMKRIEIGVSLIRDALQRPSAGGRRIPAWLLVAITAAITYLAVRFVS